MQIKSFWNKWIMILNIKVCVCPLLQVSVCVHCSRCVCVCPLLQVCVLLDGLKAEHTFHCWLYSV